MDTAHQLCQTLLEQKQKAERATLQLHHQLAEERQRAAKTIDDLTKRNADLLLAITAKGPEHADVNVVSSDGSDGDDEGEGEDSHEDFTGPPSSPGTPKTNKVKRGPKVFHRVTQNPKSAQ